MITCHAVTNGLTILPDGKITPCCEFNNNYSETYTPGKERFTDVKEAFARNEKHPGCSSCWQNEDNGLVSLRTDFYNRYKVDDELAFLDLRNTNICNLSCRMCTPYFSSSLAKMQGQNPYIVRANLDNYIADIKFDKLKDIYFTGGEPFQNPDHWRVLDLVADPSQVSLRYNSNLTTLTYKDKHIFDYWTKFKRIFFQVSLEGYGETNDLIRIGSNWNNIQQNIEQLINFSKQYENLQLAVFICISMLNVWDLEKLVDYLHSISIPEINAIYIEYPYQISLSSLPADRKLVAKKILETVIKKTSGNFCNVLQSCVIRMSTEDTTQLFQQGISQIKQQDQQHGINLFGKLQKYLI
jgi:sulfatase maturation enzyme AslB (radical SAM superfamily)